MVVTNVIDSFMGEYRWLSNFHMWDMLYEGILYPSSEHAYQAAKSLDPKVRELFSSEAFKPLTCGAAKRLGQKITIGPDWEQVKLKVMFDILTEKFKDDYLANLLVSTYPMKLVEGNSWGDKFWGVCNGGQNNLGKILMQIRDIALLEKGL